MGLRREVWSGRVPLLGSQPCGGPNTHHKGVLLMGLGHELWLTLANAQAHRPGRGSHEGMAHLTDDPEETAKLPVRGSARTALAACGAHSHPIPWMTLHDLALGLYRDSACSLLKLCDPR